MKTWSDIKSTQDLQKEDNNGDRSDNSQMASEIESISRRHGIPRELVASQYDEAETVSGLLRSNLLFQPGTAVQNELILSALLSNQDENEDNLYLRGLIERLCELPQETINPWRSPKGLEDLVIGLCHVAIFGNPDTPLYSLERLSILTSLFNPDSA